jgi:hypothetical protein
MAPTVVVDFSRWRPEIGAGDWEDWPDIGLEV